MAKKLYKAEVTTTFYFLAEEGKQRSEAHSLMDDAFNDDSLKEPFVEEADQYRDLLDWDEHEHTLVYGADNDTTLVKAFEETTGKNYQEEKEKFHAEMRAK